MTKAYDKVMIDRSYLSKLRKAYIQAHDKGLTDKDTIMFDRREYYMGYLKYLIEYAETRLK